jgi:hypothetical protein
MERGHVDQITGLNLDEVTVHDVVEDIDKEQVDEPGAGPQEGKSSGLRCSLKTPATKENSRSKTSSKRRRLSGYQSDSDYRSSDSDFSQEKSIKGNEKSIRV